jgi:hypothetical protein
MAGQTGDVVAYFFGDFISNDARTNDHGNAFQTRLFIHVMDQA